MLEPSGARAMLTQSIGNVPRPQIGNESCGRCGGLMVEDTVFGYEGDLVAESTPAWRCVNCGETIDILILANRQVGARPSMAGPRPRR